MIRFALGNLLSRPSRTILSVLGLAIAIGGMVGLFAVAGGIDAMVSRTFDQIPGLLIQQRGAPIPLFSTLPADWEDELINLPGVAVVDPEVMAWVSQIEDETIVSPPRFIIGTNIVARQQLQKDIYRQNIISGRYFDATDTGTSACIISRAISNKYEKSVGDQLLVNGQFCEIIGVYETGLLMVDGNIVTDINTVRKMARISADTVSSFYVEPHPTTNKDELKAKILSTFHDRDLDTWKAPLFLAGATRGANPLAAFARALDRSLKGEQSHNGVEPQTIPSDATVTKPAPIEVRAAEDWSQRFGEFTADLDLFLMLVTTIGILIAVLSITNTMMMSVTERTVEFGILRANGWSKAQVMCLMTIESGLLGVLGGVTGVLGGWLGTFLVNWNWADRIQLYAGPGLLLFSLLFSVSIGILGGLYPAWAAARMSPMESIRRG